MRINNLDLAWPIWLKWRATGRRFLPSQLMEEDQALLDDILTMDAAYSMVEEEMKNPTMNGLLRG